MSPKKSNKKVWIIAAAAVLLFIATVLLLRHFGYISMPWDAKNSIAIGANIQKGTLPGMTEEEILAELQREADASMVSFKLNSEPVFKNGTSEGGWYLANPAHNLFDMQVQVYAADTQQLLFDSGRIPPNHYVDYDTLLVPLAKGTHPAYADLVFFDGANIVSQSQVDLNIIIEN